MKMLPGNAGDLARGAADVHTPDELTNELYMSAQTEMDSLDERIRKYGREIDTINSIRFSNKATITRQMLNRLNKLKKKRRDAKERRAEVRAKAVLMGSVDRCFVARIQQKIDPALFEMVMSQARVDSKHILHNLTVPERWHDMEQDQ